MHLLHPVDEGEEYSDGSGLMHGEKGRGSAEIGCPEL